MVEIIGDLWELHARGDWVCVPTNKEVNRRGDAIMGRGVALQAKERFPGIAQALGKKLRDGPDQGLFWFRDWRLIAFPTKHRWREKSDIDLIAQSTNELSVLVRFMRMTGHIKGNVTLPRPGCGNGGLKWDDVRPYLTVLDDRVRVVCPPWEVMGGG